jgi:hypothetical protein
VTGFRDPAESARGAGNTARPEIEGPSLPESEGPAQPELEEPALLALEGPRKRVAVIAARSEPGAQLPPAVAGLLALFETVFPVTFERGDGAEPRGDDPRRVDPQRVDPRGIDPRGIDPRGVDAALVLDPERLPEADAGIPRLVFAADGGGQGEARRVVLADDEQLARPLRGRALAENAVAGSPQASLSPPSRAGDRMLASVDGHPVWWQVGGSSGGLWFSAYPLARLGAGETLRDHLKAGRFMGLLPLVCFLGAVVGAEGWTLPAPRASFLVDDPNLHWPSYGYLKYGELIAHAGRHGYHLAMATVPLDRWWVDRRAAALVRDNGATLSLAMHGNDHVAQELGRLRGAREAESAVAQALRRTAALERRAGVGVDRVMVPPHSACSEEALRAMFALGIEAACLNRSYPWRDGEPAPTPLHEWHPAELVAGGLPMLLRSPLVDAREDFVFRALLGQPLILYGHHWDFAEGLDILGQAAQDINAMGDVRWGPLSSIACSNYATRRVGETLFVRMYARRIAIEVPPGVRELRVLAQEPLGGAAWRRLAWESPGGAGGQRPGGGARKLPPQQAPEGVAGARRDNVVGMTFACEWGVSEPLPVEGLGGIELALVPDRALSPAAVSAPGVRPWSLLRRVMVEGRDRLQALR